MERELVFIQIRMIAENLWKVTTGKVLRRQSSPPKKLIRNPVAARLTARWAIVEPVTAQADVDLSLAGAAVLFAIALFFCHVALHALILGLCDCGHKRTLARVERSWKVPLVTCTVAAPARCLVRRASRPPIGPARGRRYQGRQRFREGREGTQMK